VETRLDELAPLLLEALHSDAPLSFSGEARAGDPANWRADVSRLAALGFEPEVRVEEGAARYAEWARRELAA
jgi:nucleoside-diphosphate-sugar epimerase